MKRIALLFLVLAFFARAEAGSVRFQAITPDQPLKQFLRAKITGQTADKSARITAASLSADGHTIIAVYLSGQRWCGATGGCRLLIVEPQGEHFIVLGNITIASLPVRLFPSQKHGYPDIGVHVHNGAFESFDAKLSFDGRRYTSNPSLPPARHAQDDKGVIVIADTSGSVAL